MNGVNEDIYILGDLKGFTPFPFIHSFSYLSTYYVKFYITEKELELSLEIAFMPYSHDL